MKRNLCLFSFFLCFNTVFSQTILWSEDFGTGCSQGQLAAGFQSVNGTWTESQTGGNDPESNIWFLSATEAGVGLGQCGDGCIGNASLSNRTLHIGANDGVTAADGGASYNAGGLCGILFCTATDRRIESPAINCSGNSNILLQFNYIEGGQGAIDDASCWYFDGSNWSLLINMPKTGLCGAQGRWDSIQVMLPASANNNPNVKIGFRWVNDDSDGVGTDPSIAIDEIQLVVADDPIPLPVASFSASKTEVCQNECIDFTDLSTNGPSAWSWSFFGANTGSSSEQNPTGICYSYPGIYLVSLVVTNAFGSDSLAMDSYISVLAAPVIPTITQVGNTLTSSYTNGNQWFFNGSPIQGADQMSYIISESGTYAVAVTDTVGCSAVSSSMELTYTGIETIGKGLGTVFPNPADGSMDVHSPAKKLLLTDVLGKPCMEVEPSAGFARFDLTGLRSGVYFLEESNGAGPKYKVLISHE